MSRVWLSPRASERFELVTTVPSGDPRRDAHHPLRRIVGDLVAPTRDRHERLLVRTAHPRCSRHFDAARYRATRQLRGEAVLLIDDMWTSGASAQSAAAALLGRRRRHGCRDRDRPASQPRLGSERPAAPTARARRLRLRRAVPCVRQRRP